ncbi:hypothetical protein AD60_09920, partial [Petrotoga sp. SL27]
RIHKQISLVKNNSDLKSLVLGLYRQILVNISARRVKVLRQLLGGVQAGFIVDRPKPKPEAKIANADFLYNMEYVWSVVLEPPV